MPVSSSEMRAEWSNSCPAGSLECAVWPDCRSPSSAAWADGRRFDLDARGRLDKTHNLDERHAGVMRTDHVSIDLTERLEIGHVFVHVDDIPGQAHEVVWPRAALRQDRHDVFERLPDLRDQSVGKSACKVPADDTPRHDKASFGHDAVRIPLRLWPAAGLKHLQTADRGSRDGFWLSHRTHAEFSILSARLQELARDNQFLDLGRAFIDAQRADFAVEAFDHLSLAHAAAAEHLDGAVDHALRGLRSRQLR